MIYKVLKVLKDNLDTELNSADSESGTVDPVEVVIDNIAREENDASAITNKVVITLLNAQEEPALKNTPRYELVSTAPKQYIKVNPPAYLNLYVMVSANRDNYEIALKDISKVIEIVQTQKNFTSPTSDFTFKAQLHPLPFEQLSYVWGLLGGKVIPSAFYKLSIVKIQKEGETDAVTIETIDVVTQKIEQEN
ncbi:DUF4255 domain-containing protein [Flavobacterium sp. RHBU_3]|uniref:DUF4255 domain-containing protein n=1 Tax=Flavobacterium sp. RHBU_3 TaxID=3391184 RepID=UPI003984C4E8